ncbi:interleukin-1 beta [Toxotes jaculatrix]|uniref:interleukin-1 beta n=1 Tax=Toxotes jaculatrix TaxID=941984 RepID=UPI001B3B0DFF|nr:interleukin-1 beta [Toxotes jaculatrix]
MSEFDLRDALESPLTPEPCCYDMKGIQQEIINLDTGLDLVVSRRRKSMQGAATLVMAANRMKNPPTSKELSNSELCMAIMESLVEETVVQKVENFTTGEKRIIFQRVNSVRECTLSDACKKDIVHATGELKLEALTLKGGHGDRKVNFRLSRYITPCVPVGETGQTVVLSVTNQNLHISCTMNGDKAELHLEQCSEDCLNRISSDNDMDRFLFYKRTTGKSVITFESVKYSGWFISTSSEKENQPVEMCRVDTAQRLTNFRVN